VRHVLAHQAGIVALAQPAPTGVFYDWDEMCRLLAAQEPEWEPGTAHGESAQFYGHLTGELVRRVDGRGPGEYLRAEICGPNDLDFQFGLGPADQARTVDLTGLDDGFRASLLEGKPPLFERALMNPPGALDPAVVNGAAWRAAEIPAINGHGTARAVAGFYHALEEGRILSKALLAEAITVHASGPDRVFGDDASWGLGFGLDGSDYGMGGTGGSYGGTNQAAGYAIGYVTGCAGTFDPLSAVENEFRRCLGLPPLE
jgi:CubicO group peptidase (beta-lactamase class C family)